MQILVTKDPFMVITARVIWLQSPLCLNKLKLLCSVKSHMAVGYIQSGDVAPLIDFGWVAPAGQMYSTVNDLNTVSACIHNYHNRYITSHVFRAIHVLVVSFIFS